MKLTIKIEATDTGDGLSIQSQIKGNATLDIQTAVLLSCLWGMFGEYKIHIDENTWHTTLSDTLKKLTDDSTASTKSS